MVRRLWTLELVLADLYNRMGDVDSQQTALSLYNGLIEKAVTFQELEDVSQGMMNRIRAMRMYLRVDPVIRAVDSEQQGLSTEEVDVEVEVEVGVNGHGSRKKMQKIQKRRRPWNLLFMFSRLDYERFHDRDFVFLYEVRLLLNDISSNHVISHLSHQWRCQDAAIYK